MPIPTFENTERPKPELMAKGVYTAEILKVSLERTKRDPNTCMWKLQLGVENPETGNMRTVFDYIVLTEKWAWKMRHLCESSGLEYTDSRETTDFEGRTVKVQIVISKGNAQYGPSNAVDDYLPRNVGEAIGVTNGAPGTTALGDEDMPF